MRLAVALVFAVIGSFSAAAQDRPSQNSCGPIEQYTKTVPAVGQLYIWNKDGCWDLVPRTEPNILTAIFGPQSYSLRDYEDGSLHFIYVAGADSSPQPHGRSFLAIRVTSLTKDASGIVSLHRHHKPVPGVHIGAYQDYHKRNIDHPAILSIFHSWQNPQERSDKPPEVRKAYAFRDGSSTISAIRRVLSIGYLTSEGHVTRVPFRLGPHLVAWSEVGDDPVYLPSLFMVTVAEAKTANGHSGATFHIRMSP